ncbi:MAG: ABC transporter ATP-binding protein [Sphingobium sp.]
MSAPPSGSIQARGIAKQYRRGLTRESMPDLRETLMAPFSRRSGAKGEEGRFWALQDVSFDVYPGQVLGILGQNGAGKSTLLKILSRIIDPTRGEIEMSGRLGCLLEVGTGFHRELTGRENIFLNGAILGMSRHETRKKLDAIIDFSGIEDFIDTPVKHYSSGMYLRLGFAVAAHIDPEILIIDEVLAVGDAAFQAKCIRKVEELVKDGRTVLIVSHQLSLIQKLCTRALAIRDGVVAADGETGAVIEDYLASLERHMDIALAMRTDRTGRGNARLSAVRISSRGSTSLHAGAPALFEIDTATEAEGVNCAFTIYDALGEAIGSFDTSNAEQNDAMLTGMRTQFRCEVPSLMLRPGRYRIGASLSSHDGIIEDDMEFICTFDVQAGFIGGRQIVAAPGYGRVEFPHRWSAD